MNNKTKRFVLGRAPLSVKSLIALGTLAVCLLVSGAASAQTGGGGAGKATFQDFHFLPVNVNPPNPDLGISGDVLEVGLLVPAVQKVREPALTLRLVGQGWTLEAPVFGDSKPVHRIFKVWRDRNSAGEMVLHLTGEGTDVHIVDHTIPVYFHVITRKQSDGKSYSAEAARVRHIGGMNVALADGSVRSISGDVYVPVKSTQQNNLKQIGLLAYNFGPVSLTPYNPALPLRMNERLDVNFLVPAVRQLTEPASIMHLIGDGWSLEIPLFGSAVPDHQGHTFYVGSANGGIWKVTDMNQADGSIREFEVPSPTFTLSLESAIQSDGRLYEVQAATAVHHATGALRNVDGSNTPILIGLLLPAVQKIR